LELKDISIENKEMKSRIKEMGGAISSYAFIIMNLQAKYDSISTFGFTKDTIYVFSDSSIINVSKTDRVFEIKDKSISIAGKFQTVDPYTLSVSKINIDYSLEIALYRSEDLSWRYLVSTSDERFIPKNIDIKTSPEISRWKYTLGGSILFSGVVPSGASIDLGIEKDGYNIYLQGLAVDKAGFYYGAGLRKSFNF
jgi:hypothetical protein